MSSHSQVSEAAVSAWQHSKRRQLVTFLRAVTCAIGVLFGTAGCLGDVASPVAVVEVASVTIAPAELSSLALNQSVILQAVLRDNNGAVVSAAPLGWSSSDPSIVRIDAQRTKYAKGALAIAQRVGTATITANSGLKEATVTITVRAPGPVTTVVLTSATAAVALGTTSQVTAILRDSDGVQLAAPVPTFASSDSTVVSVSSSGLVIARAQGTATLSAMSNGKIGALTITVTAAARAFLWTAETGMTDLGILPGFVTSKAFAVSTAGHVAGSMSTVAESLSHAFLWSPGLTAAIRDLGGLAGAGQSEAFGVNSTGQVVGYATTAGGAKHAVLWSPNGAIQDLGTLYGGNESVALAINDLGQVVGWTRRGLQTQPFIWTETAGMRAIMGSGVAFAINQAGVAAGQSGDRPFVWSASSGAALLPIIKGDNEGSVLAINNAGETVGASIGCSDDPNSYYFDDDCYSAVEHPVFWASVNALVDLRNAPGVGGVFARAAGINNSRQVVGMSNRRRAILWSAANGLRDLGVLPNRSLSAATAINDAGRVVGWSGNP